MEAITVCIPTANFPSTIFDTIKSLGGVPYKIIQDKTGCGNCLNRFLDIDSEILYFLCDDDLLVNPLVISDVKEVFKKYPLMDIIGRYYYWFTNSIYKPVRTKKSKNILELSDQISGMAFRRSAMKGKFSNEPFIEMASMVKQTLKYNNFCIIPHYTVAVRISNNGSTNPKVYEKSPTLQWYSIVGKEPFVVNNSVGLVQIRSYGTYRQLLREIKVLVWLNPWNLVRPMFLFYALITLTMPKKWLIKLTVWYKERILSRCTKF